MPLNSAGLFDEITADPRGYGYPALISLTEGGTKDGPSQDQDVAVLINTIRDGTNPPTDPTGDGGAPGGSIDIRQPSIPMKETWESIRVTDMTPLPATPTAAQLSTERRNLAWLTGLPSLPSIRLQEDDGTNTPAVENLMDMFPGGTGTRSRLIALASRSGSRAEELFGSGITVSHMDVAQALGRG